MTTTVLLTDFAWPDDGVERSVIERAGLRLVSGPAKPAPAAEIEALVRAHRPAAIMTCWAEVSAAAIGAAEELRIVARLGVGLDNIAVEAATARGIWVTNVPDYCVAEVSDQAVGFAMAWARGIVQFDREVRAGRWDPASARLRRLSELTCGIIGLGRIGRATAAKMQALGCRILAFDPHSGETPGVRMLGLGALLAGSDIVIVHAPLTPETHHLIDREAGLGQAPQVTDAVLMRALHETGHIEIEVPLRATSSTSSTTWLKRVMLKGGRSATVGSIWASLSC